MSAQDQVLWGSDGKIRDKKSFKFPNGITVTAHKTCLYLNDNKAITDDNKHGYLGFVVGSCHVHDISFTVQYANLYRNKIPYGKTMFVSMVHYPEGDGSQKVQCGAILCNGFFNKAWQQLTIREPYLLRKGINIRDMHTDYMVMYHTEKAKVDIIVSYYAKDDSHRNHVVKVDSKLMREKWHGVDSYMVSEYLKWNAVKYTKWIEKVEIPQPK